MISKHFSAKMNGASKLVTFGWMAFIAENLILSENRTQIIERFGDRNYHLTYNTLSSLSCISIAAGFIKGRNSGPLIAQTIPKLFKFQSSKAMPWIACTLRVLGLGIASQMLPAVQAPFKYGGQYHGTLDVQCPINFANKDSPAKMISRHPMLWSMGLVGLSFALQAKTQTQLIFNMFPLAFTFVGGLHQDSRFRRGIGGNIDGKSSFVPFASVISGEVDLGHVLEKTKALNLAVAFILALVTI